MRGSSGDDWARMAASWVETAAKMAGEATEAACRGHQRHEHKHEHEHEHGQRHGWGGKMREPGGFGWMFGAGPWGPPPGPWGRSWSRGGPGRRGQRARKGNLRAAILALLAEEPRNGYQIIQEVAERSDGAWRPSPGAVYPALQQLADEGLIRGEEAEGRKTYSLTDAGRTYVEEHADTLTDPWAEMTPEYGDGVPDLFKQAAQTGAAVMQIVHTGSPDQVAQAKDVLADARRKLYRILADEDTEDTEE